MTPAQERLAARLGHAFRDAGLLVRALTHRSMGSGSNERLEFLGDAILGFLVAEDLFRSRPDAPEGKLTRLRALVVRRESLAAAARRLGVGDALRLGAGELKTGGRERDSILADALEAIVGALYLDSDLATCRDRVLAMLGDRIEAVVADDGSKDAKTRLQELLQGQGRPLPAYRVVETSGSDHRRVFTVRCRIEGVAGEAVGTGSSRKRAEQEAAARAMVSLDALEG